MKSFPKPDASSLDSLNPKPTTATPQHDQETARHANKEILAGRLSFQKPHLFAETTLRTPVFRPVFWPLLKFSANSALRTYCLTLILRQRACKPRHRNWLRPRAELSPHGPETPSVPVLLCLYALDGLNEDVTAAVSAGSVLQTELKRGYGGKVLCNPTMMLMLARRRPGMVARPAPGRVCPTHMPLSRRGDPSRLSFAALPERRGACTRLRWAATRWRPPPRPSHHQS